MCGVDVRRTGYFSSPVTILDRRGLLLLASQSDDVRVRRYKWLDMLLPFLLSLKYQCLYCYHFPMKCRCLPTVACSQSIWVATRSNRSNRYSVQTVLMEVLFPPRPWSMIHVELFLLETSIQPLGGPLTNALSHKCYISLRGCHTSIKLKNIMLLKCSFFWNWHSMFILVKKKVLLSMVQTVMD